MGNPRLDFILFADRVYKNDEGYWSLEGVMTSLQRIEPAEGMRHEIRKLEGLYRISECPTQDEIELRMVGYLSDGITRISDPDEPFRHLPTTAAGIAFGPVTMLQVPYDINGLYFAAEIPPARAGEPPIEIGREFLAVSQIY